MPVYKGTAGAISAAYIGSTVVKNIYLGATNVWSAAPPIAYDSTGTTGVPAGSHAATAQTYNHTIASAAEVTILCGLSFVGDGSHPWSTFAPTAITFDGNAMTLVGEIGANNVTNAVGFSALYKCVYTGSGTKTVSITGGTAGRWWANTVAYTGVASVGSPQYNYGSSTNPTTGAVDCVAGQVLAGIIGINNRAVSSPAGSPNACNSRYSQSGTANIFSGYILDGPGGTTTETLSCTASTAAWDTVSAVLSPAA